MGLVFRRRSEFFVTLIILIVSAIQSKSLVTEEIPEVSRAWAEGAQILGEDGEWTHRRFLLQVNQTDEVNETEIESIEKELAAEPGGDSPHDTHASHFSLPTLLNKALSLRSSTPSKAGNVSSTAAAASTRSKPAPAAAAPATPGKIGKYPPCPTHPLMNSKTKVSLETWMIAGLKGALVLDHPFKRSIFWCNVFPPAVYRELSQLWLPPSVMHKDAKSGKSRQVSHRFAGARYKTSLPEFMKIPALRGRRLWKSFDKGRALWKRVSDVLQSKPFVGALWQKMGITKKWLYRDFRIQSDYPGGTGYSIGVHPDISKKIATMMFYFPTGDAAQRKRQARDFGTCLHTRAQYAKRSKYDGQSKCEHKFMFLPNSGYSFTVSKYSYHSVEPRKANSGLRRTFMLNWYRAKWVN